MNNEQRVQVLRHVVEEPLGLLLRLVRRVQVVVLYLIPVRVDRHRDVGTSRLDLLLSETI